MFDLDPVKAAREANRMLLHLRQRTAEYAAYPDQNIAQYAPRIEEMAHKTREHRDYLMNCARRRRALDNRVVYFVIGISLLYAIGYLIAFWS